MSEMVTINAIKREETGKSACRQIRKAGLIPGNIIGKTAGTSTMIKLDPKYLPHAWKGGKKFNMVFEGKTSVVKIQELHINPVKRNALHVDLIVE